MEGARGLWADLFSLLPSCPHPASSPPFLSSPSSAPSLFSLLLFLLFPLSSPLLSSLLQSQGLVGPGRETCSCHHVWNCVWSSHLLNVNRHKDPGGSWSPNAKAFSLLDLKRVVALHKCVNGHKDRGLAACQPPLKTKMTAYAPCICANNLLDRLCHLDLQNATQACHMQAKLEIALRLTRGITRSSFVKKINSPLGKAKNTFPLTTMGHGRNETHNLHRTSWHTRHTQPPKHPRCSLRQISPK